RVSCYFLSTRRPRPSSTLFPYTTLFRSSWAELTRRVQGLASGETPPTPFIRAYRAMENGDLEQLRGLLDEHPELVRQRGTNGNRSEEHTSELQSLRHLVCRLLLEKKKKN